MFNVFIRVFLCHHFDKASCTELSKMFCMHLAETELFSTQFTVESLFTFLKLLVLIIICASPLILP